ncbi:MAG: hypothetical protein K2X53_00265 [Alphaproteobacteria bacterium]|nr:hypothetical protein [Alphaproteobacteria bacterium]
MLILITSQGNASTQPSMIVEERDAYLTSLIDLTNPNASHSSTPSYNFEALASHQALDFGVAGLTLKQFGMIAEDPLSPLRFLACAHLCGLHMEKEYREIGHSFIRTWANTYGDKDQYEAADYLLTYGSAEDQENAKKSLLWIFENRSEEKESAVFSLWIHGGKDMRKTLRSYVRSKAQEEAETAYNFAELLNNHGNSKDRLIAGAILSRWTVADEAE